MTWTHINTPTRLVALLCGIGGMAAAWMLLRISKSGIEDVPPPVIVLALLAGLGFVGVAAMGRFPRPGPGKNGP